MQLIKKFIRTEAGDSPCLPYPSQYALIALAWRAAVVHRRLAEQDLRRTNWGRFPRIVVANWNPITCKHITRFWPVEIIEIHQGLDFPQFVRLDNRCVEDGVTSLAILLARLATPSRYYDLCRIFGRELSIIGRIVRNSLAWMYQHWRHRLKWSRAWMTPARLQQYADDLVSEKGCPLPNCIGYLDATVWRICRPGFNQRAFYSGHKRVHGLKFQAFTTPDGITVDLSDACLGARHDRAVLAASGLTQVLRHYAKGIHGQQMLVYADKGYFQSDLIIIPFPGTPGRMPEHHRQFNLTMSRCRMTVEHEFGRTRNFFRLMQYEDNLKFFLSELNMLYTIATLFKNLLLCCGHGGGGGVFPPPSLAEYLRGA